MLGLMVKASTDKKASDEEASVNKQKKEQPISELPENGSASPAVGAAAVSLPVAKS